MIEPRRHGRASVPRRGTRHQADAFPAARGHPRGVTLAGDTRPARNRGHGTAGSRSSDRPRDEARRARLSAAAARRRPSTPPSTRDERASRPHSKATANSARVSSVHDDEHHRRRRRTARCRRRRSRAGRRAATSSSDVGGEPARAPPGSCAIVTRARPGHHDEDQEQPVERPAERHPRQRLVRGEERGRGEQPHDPAPEQRDAGDDQAGAEHVVGGDERVDARPPRRRRRSSRRAAATRTGTRAP